MLILRKYQTSLQNFFPRENEAIKHDLVAFKVQCLKVFCYHGNKSTILLFYSICRTAPEVSSKLYFVEICQVAEKLWLFNHKRADFWLPNFGFKRPLLCLLKGPRGWGVFWDPLMISGTTKASPMKLCTVIVNSDLHETKKLIYHLKGNDESFPKM